MPPKTKPRSKRIRPQVVQHSPQIFFGSTANGATRTQPGLSQPRVGFTPHNAAKAQPIVNEWDRPSTKDNSTNLEIEHIGTIARNGRHYPLHYKGWRLMPRSYKDEMLKTVKTKFELQPGQESYVPHTSSNIEVPSASMSRSMRIWVHSYVVLKSLVDINEIIARGYVKEMDYVRVNGEELGSGWCEIIIQSSIKKDVRLLKPYDHIQTIGDSLGAPVAWPLSLVALDINDD